jgi:hypothetical protein
MAALLPIFHHPGAFKGKFVLHDTIITIYFSSHQVI